VDVHVEGRSRTSAHRATDHRGEHKPEVGHAARCEEHDRHGRYEQQLEDTWLRQSDIGLDRLTDGLLHRRRLGHGRDTDRLLRMRCDNLFSLLLPASTSMQEPEMSYRDAPHDAKLKTTRAPGAVHFPRRRGAATELG